MKCPHCQSEVTINHEFCPRCGQRITLAFDDIAASVHVDAAYRRGQRLERTLKWIILFLIFTGAMMYGINDLWDRELVYDGNDLPPVEAPAAALGDLSGVPLNYKEVFALRPPEGLPPRGYAWRMGALRNSLRASNGGRAEGAEAIDRGLRYMMRLQQQDGSWLVNTEGLNIDKARDEAFNFKWGQTGLTALCLMAYLGEGHLWTPDVQGQTSPYASNVKRGLEFLVKGQDPLNGRFGPPEGNFMYNHGLATLAVSEAAALSGAPDLRAAAQKGVDLIERTQGEKGGWGYRDVAGARQDTSVSAWQVQALLAAREAGLKVNDEVLQKALGYYQAATDAQAGIVSYDFTDRQVRPSLFGVALMLRLYLGEAVTTPDVRWLTRMTAQTAPTWKRGWGRSWKEGRTRGVDDSDRATTFDPYRWYFATYGLFFAGGEEWEPWDSALRDALINLQDGDGAWRANDIWSVKAGPAYSTSMCILCLQVHYRLQ